MTSSVPVLVKRHVFGINNRFSDNIHFLSSSVLIYVAGRNIVFYNLEEHTQRFVVGSSPSTENWVPDPEICCIALSPCAGFLAIAERGEKPSVTILDTASLRKTKFLVIPSSSASAVRSKEISAMSFSGDSRWLAVQCGAPDWKLCVFEWEEGTMAHSVSTSKDMTPVHAVAYCFSTNNEDEDEKAKDSIGWLSVCHEEAIQMFHHTADEMKPETIEIYPYESDSKWTCVAWIDAETLIAGNSGGDVIVLRERKFQEVILSKTGGDGNNKTGDKAIPITYIQCINASILAIGARDCTVSFLQKSIENGTTNWNLICCINIGIESNNDGGDGGDDSGHAQLSTTKDQKKPSEAAAAQRRPSVKGGYALGMSVDPSSRRLLITTANKQIYCVDISNLSVSTLPTEDHLKSGAVGVGKGTSTISAESIQKSLTLPLGHFHCGGITGLDICVRKPWLVSCSAEDQSICIWNYLTKKLEIVKYFNSPIYSVSLHPSGLHILGGFEDKLKLLNVLMDDIEPYKDFHIVRSCRECRFANGGHIFAAVNGDKIHIYSTYSGELISILRGHNQKIRSLYFNLSDTSLISAGAEGAVYEWSMFSFQRLQEHVNRQCPLNTAIMTKDGKIYCTGNAPLLNEIIDSQLEKEMETGTIEMTRLLISHLPQRMLFASTINGLIRSMKFPLTTDHLDYVGHLGRIERIVMSQDDVYLFSCGAEDGCISIYEIRDKEGRLATTSDTSSGGDHWSQEILVTTSYLFAKKQLVTSLTLKVDELALHNEYQLRLREMHYQDTLKSVADKFNSQLQSEKLKYEVLKDEQQDLEMEYEEKMSLAEDEHTQSVNELSTFYQSQLMAEITKFNELSQTLSSKQSRWETQTLSKHDEHAANAFALKNKFAAILNAEVERKESLEAELLNLTAEYAETKRQLLEDFDTEILELNEKYVTILNEERESTLRLKGENGVMKKKFTSLQNEIEDQVEETKKMNSQENNFKRTIVSLKQEIEKLDNAMLSRDNIIGAKEKKIYKLKKKNQNLEKHKFVLDFKIKSLKKQIEPRQNKILQISENVKKLDVELEKLHKKNGSLKTVIAELTHNIEVLSKSLLRKKETLKKLQSVTSKFGYDLSVIIQFIQSPSELRAYFVEKMSRWREGAHSNEFEINKNVQNEYQRQRNHLLLSINSLKKKLVRQSKANQAHNYQICIHNAKYMSEIQTLRKELKQLTQVTTDKKKKVIQDDDTLLLSSQIAKQNAHISSFWCEKCSNCELGGRRAGGFYIFMHLHAVFVETDEE